MGPPNGFRSSSALRGLARIVNRAEDPHDSRRTLLERARCDGVSEATESAVPPRTCVRAAALDTERRERSEPIRRAMTRPHLTCGRPCRFAVAGRRSGDSSAPSRTVGMALDVRLPAARAKDCWMGCRVPLQSVSSAAARALGAKRHRRRAATGLPPSLRSRSSKVRCESCGSSARFTMRARPRSAEEHGSPSSGP